MRYVLLVGVIWGALLFPSAAVMAQGPEPLESEVESIELPEVDPLEVSGDIITAGSSTVYPLSEAVAALFRDEGYSGNITIDRIGSGAGLTRFCEAGETDIANASRRIKEAEVEQCRSIGRDPLEFRIGTDGLAVVVSRENDFVRDVTLEELARIFSDKSEKWSDIRAGWPAEPILRFTPGTDSGTYLFFIEEVMGDDAESFLRAGNLQLSEDDYVLVQGVLGSPYAIGFFGYAYYQENADRLNVVAIEGVTPTAETVDSGEYALARPLFLYSAVQIMQEKPQVSAFINFYLTRVNEVIREVGYFPASTAALNLSKMKWLDAVEGR